MRFLGDVTKIKGAEIEPVDVITFGAPCQDLSVAGKRAGMKHADRGDGETTRSGLFFEAIRIIREMRENDVRSGRTGRDVRPRWAIFENVPGVFSSNEGRDFQAVLTEFVRIVEPEAPDVPLPEQGRWSDFGLLMGEGWSVCWRVHDAQYWGVPQRRKRISVVADFGGRCAGEVQTLPESLSRDSESSGKTRKGTAGRTENRLGSASESNGGGYR